MVGLGGLEPPASPLSGVRSNQLSYRPNGGIIGIKVGFLLTTYKFDNYFLAAN